MSEADPLNVSVFSGLLFHEADARAQSLIRERLGKLIGMLSSAFLAERVNALHAIDKLFSSTGLSWVSLAHLAASAEWPDAARDRRREEREKLFARLLADRLDQGLDQAWAMSDGESINVRQMRKQCDAGELLGRRESDIALAIEVVDKARFRASNGWFDRHGAKKSPGLKGRS